MDYGVRGEERLSVVGGFAVVTQVKQTFRTVEVGRFDPLATETGVAPVRRFGNRLRALARPHRVAASVTDRRRRQRRHGRAVGGQPRHVSAGGAGDQVP